ncbi:hypothetical protein ABG79_02040 [Caloramator mitchellensis]|uniref:DUF2500 domain-containing protein n=1 Tax=Caloramator mitchellensis TaxID=908809 RepID=A0A0R3JRT1_CALMK|nr:DUF2500 domain-containing protein [Caloramator mitchellensis]KRQ86199.1 hypothetical protein ABG79_02040 [Caloramator mitchellensis]
MHMGFWLDSLFFIIPVIIITMFVITMIINVKNYIKNSSSPILSEKVRVVSKRFDVRHTHHAASENTTHVTSSTTYYITFENEAGQRFELRVGPSDYGLIVEGDEGIVTYQGEWFKRFERNIRGAV